MWDKIKSALLAAKDATGIEIPGLPADLGAIGESAATAVQSVTESASGVIDTGGAALTDGVAGATGTAATAVDEASQALPDFTGPIGANPMK
jgi:hypothetical protein